MRQFVTIRRAFTLVEVLVVVAIIALTGAILVPQILQSGSLTVQAAGRMVIADMLYAQNDAIAAQTSRRMVFDVANNSYRMTNEQGNTLSVSWKTGGESSENYIVSLANDSRFQGVRLANVNFGGTTHIEFDALGAPNEGGSLDLIAGNFHYRISVAAFTGRVTIEPVTGE